jgi:hypothetical protein
MPHVSIAHKGADGQNLHGGAAQRYGQGGFLEGYQYVNGQMYAGMVVCEFVLADEGPGDGGLAVVRSRIHTLHISPSPPRPLPLALAHSLCNGAGTVFILLLLLQLISVLRI